MATIDQTPKKRYYLRYNSLTSKWEVFYFATDASQVAETTGRKFVDADEKAVATTLKGTASGSSNTYATNLKSLGTDTISSNLIALSNIKDDLVSGAHQMVYNISRGDSLGTSSGASGHFYKGDIIVFDGHYVYKVKNDITIDEAHTGPGTSSAFSDASLNTADTGYWDGLFYNKLLHVADVATPTDLTDYMLTDTYIDSNSKIKTTYLPDQILGQLVYGGTVTGAGVASLTSNAQAKLGTSSETITLTNSANADTGYSSSTVTSKQEGIFYVVSSNGNFASLDLQVGDWLLVTGTAWKKIDNTDAVTSVNSRIGGVKTYVGGVLSSSNVTYGTSAPIYQGDIFSYTDANSVTTLYIVTTNITSWSGTKTGAQFMTYAGANVQPLGHAAATSTYAGVVALHTSNDNDNHDIGASDNTAATPAAVEDYVSNSISTAISNENLKQYKVYDSEIANGDSATAFQNNLNAKEPGTLANTAKADGTIWLVDRIKYTAPSNG